MVGFTGVEVNRSHRAPWCGWPLLAAAIWLTFAPATLAAFPLRSEASQSVGPEIEPALHKYLYANADSVTYSDPSGHVSMAEIQIGMVIVGTLNALAINSGRNTINRANGIFSPTGEINTNLAILEQTLFIVEEFQKALALGTAGVLVKRGAEAALRLVAPRFLKAFDALSRAKPADFFKAQLARMQATSRDGAAYGRRSEPFEEFIEAMPNARPKELTVIGHLRVRNGPNYVDVAKSQNANYLVPSESWNWLTQGEFIKNVIERGDDVLIGTSIRLGDTVLRREIKQLIKAGYIPAEPGSKLLIKTGG